MRRQIVLLLLAIVFVAFADDQDFSIDLLQQYKKSQRNNGIANAISKEEVEDDAEDNDGVENNNDDDVDNDDVGDVEHQPKPYRTAKRIHHIQGVEDYVDGDLEPEYLEKALPHFEPMIGKWDILLSRSEPMDAILTALGVSFIKRSVLKRAQTQVEVDPIKSENDRDFTIVRSFLPMNTIKAGQIFVDNRPFSVVDSDTGVWKSTAMIADGRLLQKRVSRKGVMYDVRATFAADPEGVVSNKPLHLFKWTFITRKGEKFVSHRWFYKMDDGSLEAHTE
eukprot:Selendium_serpulae@DN4778_c0_g1_i2.p1